VRMRARTSLRTITSGYVIDLEVTSRRPTVPIAPTASTSACRRTPRDHGPVGSDRVGGRNGDERYADGARRLRSDLKGIYDQYSGPDPAAVQAVAAKGLTGKVSIIGDDGVSYEMCYINSGLMAGAQSQPANLYAQAQLRTPWTRPRASSSRSARRPLALRRSRT